MIHLGMLQTEHTNPASLCATQTQNAMLGQQRKQQPLDHKYIPTGVHYNFTVQIKSALLYKSSLL